MVVLEGYDMQKQIDKDTRYFLDIDVVAKKVVAWDYGQRYELEQKLPHPNHRRIFITKGQYNKLIQDTNTL